MFDCRSVLFRTLLATSGKLLSGFLLASYFSNPVNFRPGVLLESGSAHAGCFYRFRSWDRLCCAQRSRASRVVTNGFLLTCTSRDDPVLFVFTCSVLALIFPGDRGFLCAA